jgi:hypothetical protein
VKGTYEPYTQAELLLDITLEEVARTNHAKSHVQQAPVSVLIGGWHTCQFYPCRMINLRREEAEELIMSRLEKSG